MIFIPYSTEVLIRRLPLGNLLIMALCVLCFLFLVTGILPEWMLLPMILEGWHPYGLVGHQFLHAGWGHLAGNMLILWVFGNTVNEKVGSFWFAGCFLLTGILAGALHVLLDGSPAIGASGAINGIVGIYLVLHPINQVNCAYWFMFKGGTFQLRSYWLILSWFIWDAWGALSGRENGIAYWAHIGGFLSGVTLGVILLKAGIARMADYDNPTLLDYLGLGGVKEEEQPQKPFVRSRPSPPAGGLPRRPLHPSPRPAEPVVKVDCPHCQRDLDMSQVKAGMLFRCPACKGEIQIEAEGP